MGLSKQSEMFGKSSGNEEVDKATIHFKPKYRQNAISV